MSNLSYLALLLFGSDANILLPSEILDLLENGVSLGGLFSILSLIFYRSHGYGALFFFSIHILKLLN